MAVSREIGNERLISFLQEALGGNQEASNSRNAKVLGLHLGTGQKAIQKLNGANEYLRLALMEFNELLKPEEDLGTEKCRDAAVLNCKEEAV